MRTLFSAALVLLGVIVSLVVAEAQSSDAKRATVELTGCVSVTPSEGGQFAFVDAASGGTYRLRGKGINKYAGQRVTIVGNPNSKRVRFRTGLWPSPNVAAQAGALDPAQESIARQPGGSASGAQSSAPELQVVRMRNAEGNCR